MYFPSLRSLPWMLAAGSVALSNAAVLDVLPGLNNAPITGITFTRDGSTYVQNTEPTAAENVGPSPVLLQSVRITDGGAVNLTYFNTEDAKVVNVNPSLSTIGGVGVDDGIGVYDNGVLTQAKDDGLEAFADAFAGTTLDTDLRNYGFHDRLKTPIAANAPVLDLLFYRALKAEDFLVVSERWGNSTFTVTALTADGTPYQFANSLRLGGNGGDAGVGYQVHDWNTGIAQPGMWDYQAMTLTAVSVEKFFEGVSPANSGDVYGLRIFNSGEADVKILGASANTFNDNPENPQLVPEPSSFLMALFGSLFFLTSRTRARRKA